MVLPQDGGNAWMLIQTLAAREAGELLDAAFHRVADGSLRDFEDAKRDLVEAHRAIIERKQLMYRDHQAGDRGTPDRDTPVVRKPVDCRPMGGKPNVVWSGRNPNGNGRGATGR
jgi:hypothetical protein